MKTAPEFMESVCQPQRELFVLGEKVAHPAQHAILSPSLCALAKTYELAHDDRYQDLFLRQGVDGEAVSCFTSLHHSPQDLLDKVKVLRILGQETGTCFMRCVGWDALNALESTTYEMDLSLEGTSHLPVGHDETVEFPRAVF